jgi:ACS family tartrate transporter-like MFS transporter
MMIGVIRQQTGSYTWGLYFVAGLLALSAIVVLLLAASGNRAQTAKIPHPHTH